MDIATMLSGLSAEDLSNPQSLLGAVVVLIVLGGLIPRWMHQSMMSLKDETIVDLRRVNEALVEQNKKLTSAAEIGVHIAEDLHKLVQGRDSHPNGGE